MVLVGQFLTGRHGQSLSFPGARCSQVAQHLVLQITCIMGWDNANAPDISASNSRQ
jgi:hypothetical protein